MNGNQAQIPRGWVWTTIGDLTYPFVDQGMPEEAFSYIEISSIDNPTKRIVRANKLPPNGAPTRARQRLKAGDVLVSMTRPNLNAVALVPPSLHGAVGSTGFDVLRPIIVSSKWLFYAVQQQGFIDEMSRRVLGVVYPAIRPKDVRSFPIPLPPLAEQLKIIDEVEKQFTRLEAAGELLIRILNNIKYYRTVLLTSACMGRLVPSEKDLADREGRSYVAADVSILESEDDLGECYLPDLPDGWMWANLGQLASSEPNSITDGPFGSNLKTSHYTDEGPRVVRLQNIGDGEFIDEKAHISPEHYRRLAKHKVEVDDLVIAMLGERLPRACVVPGWLGPAIVKADCVRFSANKEIVSPQYLSLALNCEATRTRTSALVHGVGRPRLNLGEIKRVIVPVPPLAEQARICQEVERQLSILGNIQGVVKLIMRRIELLRQGILRQAFAGGLMPLMTESESAVALLERIQAERRLLVHQAQRKPGKRIMKIRSEKPDAMGSLLDILREAGKALSPEDLFQLAGFSSRSVDSIDRFYEELKREVDTGSIVEERNAVIVKLRAANHEIG